MPVNEARRRDGERRPGRSLDRCAQGRKVPGQPEIVLVKHGNVRRAGLADAAVGLGGPRLALWRWRVADVEPAGESLGHGAGGAAIVARIVEEEFDAVGLLGGRGLQRRAEEALALMDRDDDAEPGVHAAAAGHAGSGSTAAGALPAKRDWCPAITAIRIPPSAV